MKNYNESNGRRNGGNNKRNFHQNNDDRKAKIAALVEKQTNNLMLIDLVAQYLNDYVDHYYHLAEGEKLNRVNVKDVIEYLAGKGFTPEDSKAISQINYLLLDLAYAQTNNYMTSTRINLRIVYIVERLKTAYRKELAGMIDEMIAKYDLFKVPVEVTEEETVDTESAKTSE